MRDAIGGTWDIHRYPGIRSDSDMFTFGYKWRPWASDQTLADGPAILQYIRDTATESGIDRNIRFGQKVVADRGRPKTPAGRSTQSKTPRPARSRSYTANFVYLCSGYYRYDEGFIPDFHGLESFQGQIVHPMNWPDDLDYAGKKVVDHRQWRDRDHAGSGDGQRGRPRHDAAALADLRRHGARRATRSHGSRAASCPKSRPTCSTAGRASCSRWSCYQLTSAPAAPDEEVLPRHGQAPAARRLRRRQALHAQLQPVGPAPLRRARRRPLQGDQPRPGLGRHRHDRHLHRARASSSTRARSSRPTSSSPPPASTCR